VQQPNWILLDYPKHVKHWWWWMLALDSDWERLTHYPGWTDGPGCQIKYEAQQPTWQLFIISITTDLMSVQVEFTTISTNHFGSVPQKHHHPQISNCKTGEHTLWYSKSFKVVWSFWKLENIRDIFLCDLYWPVHDHPGHGTTLDILLKINVPTCCMTISFHYFYKFWTLNWNDYNKLTAQEWIYPPYISGSFHKLIPAGIKWN
jgi:hypothetical protein